MLKALGMKANLLMRPYPQTMRHAVLIQEVAGLLKNTFTPKVSEMKKAIDHLLDKEYLERVEGSKDQ